MSAAEWQEVIEVTAIGGLVTSVVMAIVWNLSGCWIRERDVLPPSRSEANRFLSLSFAVIVVLFFTIPMVIEGYGDTYPIDGETLLYIVCLCLASLMMVVYHVVSYRRQPSQQSAFIVGTGLLGAVLMMAAFVFFAVAIAASAYT